MEDQKKIPQLKTDTDLALIYAGCRKPFPDGLVHKIRELEDLMNSQITPAFWWTLCDLSFEEDGIRLGDTDIVLRGELAKKQLSGSEQAVFMAGTLSVSFDRALQRIQIQSPADALLFDALGSSAIESVIDLAEDEIRKTMPDYEIGQRFSCGYGDLPLELQKDLFETFQLSRRCGIYLTDSLMMNPTKSITAFAPLKKRAKKDPRKDDIETEKKSHLKNCEECSMKDTCGFSRQSNQEQSGYRSAADPENGI